MRSHSARGTHSPRSPQRTHSPREYDGSYDETERGSYDDDGYAEGQGGRDAWGSAEGGGGPSVRVVDWPVEPEPSLHEDEEAAPYARGGHAQQRDEAERFDGNSEWASAY